MRVQASGSICRRHVALRVLWNVIGAAPFIKVMG